MLNFTEHMKRIIQLAEQSLVHVQSDRFKPACEAVFNISTHCDQAAQLLDDMSLLKQQGKDID